MPRPLDDPDVRSLERVAAGDRVTLRAILFDAVRERCDRAGVAEGDTVRVREESGADLVVETEDGREVRFKRETAQFIQVSVESRDRGRYATRRRPLT